MSYKSKIEVSINYNPGACDHCGTKMFQGFMFKYQGELLYIGRVCVSKITNICTTGNIHRSRTRLESYLNKGSEEDREERWEALSTEA